MHHVKETNAGIPISYFSFSSCG